MENLLMFCSSEMGHKRAFANHKMALHVRFIGSLFFWDAVFVNESEDYKWQEFLVLSVF
jgi:hypothetical protein